MQINEHVFFLDFFFSKERSNGVVSFFPGTFEIKLCGIEEFELESPDWGNDRKVLQPREHWAIFSMRPKFASPQTAHFNQGHLSVFLFLTWQVVFNS